MKAIGILISIIIAQSAGIIGSFFTINSVSTWYKTITKPFLNPPSWIFGPVWITLYTLMGISSYFIWQQRELPGAKLALTFYAIQLFLNTLWSILFFGLKNPGLAFAEIILLLISIVITTVLFWRISPVAGWLLVPYIIWVAFASYLNFSIWRLN